jgi:hypothetical protein
MSSGALTWLGSLYRWKALNEWMSKGSLTWFEIVWSYGVEAVDYWTIFSMKIKSNRNWKLYWNLRVFLVLFEESPQLNESRFNQVYFTIFRAKVWNMLFWSGFFGLEIQNKLQKLSLEGKSVEPTICFHIVKFRNFQFWKCVNKECVHTWANNTGDTNVYELKRWTIEEHICSYFATIRSKEVFLIGERSMFQKILMMG